jgi:hypothetical protein
MRVRKDATPGTLRTHVVCRHRMGGTRIGRRWKRLVDAVQPPTEARVIRDPAVEGAGRCRMHRPLSLVLANGVLGNEVLGNWVFANWLARERGYGERRHRELKKPDMETQQWGTASGKRRPGNQTSTRQGHGRPRASGGCG